MLKKQIIIFAVIAVGMFISGCQGDTKVDIKTPVVSGNFSFTVLEAGKADAIFMQTQNHSIILDCGEKDDGDKLVELMQEKGINDVDYIFITHFDKDHVGGFPEVMENVTAGNIIVPDYEGNNKEYKKYLKTVNDKNLTITSLSEDMHFTLDDVVFEVSVPKQQSYDESDNDFSLVISVTHGENTFLFAGDAEQDRLDEVLSDFGKQYDFLKVPHHGKYNPNTEKFLNTIRPTYSVICDSAKNPADKETIAVLEVLGSEIYRTKDGSVEVSSNGKEIKIIQ